MDYRLKECSPNQLKYILRLKYIYITYYFPKYVCWRTILIEGEFRKKGEKKMSRVGYHLHLKCYFHSNKIYSVSTNFRLELIDPFAREVEGQQFFSSDAVLSLVRF